MFALSIRLLELRCTTRTWSSLLHQVCLSRLRKFAEVRGETLRLDAMNVEFASMGIEALKASKQRRNEGRTRAAFEVASVM